MCGPTTATSTVSAAARAATSTRSSRRSSTSRFVEAVELLADRVGFTVTYTGAATSVQRDRGSRSRLIAANAAAQEFYAEALKSDEAAPARQYLLDRNFDAETAAHFGCGFAPSGWDTLDETPAAQGF